MLLQSRSEQGLGKDAIQTVTADGGKPSTFLVSVIPAGSKRESILFKKWIPAFAGMTKFTTV